MAAVSVPDLYAQYLNRLILHGLQSLAGMPRSTATDENAFRQAAIDPVWASLPQPFRMVGREKLRWDEYLIAARGEVFQLGADGKLAVRSDAASRLQALAARLLGQPGGAPPTPPAPAAGAVPLAMPVTQPAAPTAPSPPQPAPRPQSTPASSVASQATSPPKAPTGPAIRIDLGTTYSD